MEYHVTPVGKCLFPDLAQATSYKNDPTKPAFYRVTLELEQDCDLSIVVAACDAEAAANFGRNWPEGATFGDFRSLPDWLKEDHRPFTLRNDVWQLRFKSKHKPGLFDHNAIAIDDPDAIYAGCRIRVGFTTWSYNNEARGVKLNLENVQKVGDGPRISGGSRVAVDQAFSPIEQQNEDVALADLF